MQFYIPIDGMVQLASYFLILLFSFSACHSSMKNWNEAIEDALTCVSKDPSFIKGYYRLAAAYTEIGNYDDAINALQTALTKEPGHPSPTNVDHTSQIMTNYKSN
jgi:tetratricopeptide (TPR) repeat protein